MTAIDIFYQGEGIREIAHFEASPEHNFAAIKIAINGQTGRVAGRAPIAWWKVILTGAVVVAIGVVIALLVAWSQGAGA